MFRIAGIHIKHIKLSALFVLSPFYFFAQTLTGLWTGALSNDSTTIRKDQSFEIALTEYRGKVYGYSRSEFIVNDTLYYILKRVKGTIDGDICEVTDDEIVSYNFRGKLDKGIKVTSTFRRNQSDSTWYLDGTWKTNATRKYYSVTGKVGLKEEKDLAASKLFPHLEELNLADDVAFYKERKEGPVIVKVAHPEKIKTEYNERPAPVLVSSNMTAVPLQPNLPKTETPVVPVTAGTSEFNVTEVESASVVHAEKDPVADLPANDIKNIPATTVMISPAVVSKTMTEIKKPESIPVPDNDNSSVASVPVSEKNITRPVDPSVQVKSEAVTTKVTKEEKPVEKITSSSVKQQPSVTNKPDTKTVAVTNKPEVVKKETVLKDSVGRASSAPVSKTIVKQDKPVVKTQPLPDMQTVAVINKPDIKIAATNNPVTENKEPEQVKITAVSDVKKPAVDIIARDAVIEGRRSEFSQVVNYKADSLELSLYDNGEIDGDTVSVFMNGEVLLSRQGLKASAIKKTIYINPGNEEFTLVMFAENLGKYPPNTGLLVVHDGDDVYNLRFSSDLKKSSGIVFRRKK